MYKKESKEALNNIDWMIIQLKQTKNAHKSGNHSLEIFNLLEVKQRLEQAIKNAEAAKSK